MKRPSPRRAGPLDQRAQHGVGFDAANLSDFNGQRRLAGFGGRAWPGRNEGDLVAGLKILRAANDLAFAGPVVDAAEGKFAGVGMRVPREHLGDDNAVQFAADFLHALDFEAEEGEALGQLSGRPVEVDSIGGAS